MKVLQEQVCKKVGTIIGDKAYIIQYIADMSRYSDYLPIVQNMVLSLAIRSSTETGTGLLPDNGTKSYPGTMEMCYGGICYETLSR